MQVYPWQADIHIMIYDAHIHLEQYSRKELEGIFRSWQVDGVIAVSTNLDSCRRTLQLSRQFPGRVFPAFGWHPEQPLHQDIEPLFDFIMQHQEEMAAVGEVGLPYYTRQQHVRLNHSFELEPYICLLDRFIGLAKELDKPVVLHAVHEDAAIACDLLEKHGWHQAHFHWYKGDVQTTARMACQGYFISVTPDIFYKRDTQILVADYPLEQMMAETDGPWSFKGPFSGQITHPDMVADVIREIAKIKQIPVNEVRAQIAQNTRQFYQI